MSDKTMVDHYPAALDAPFTHAQPPLKLGIKTDNREYFNNYRNDHLSKFQIAPYTWGNIESMYMPKPDSRVQRDLNKYLRLPKPEYTMLDAERMSEIDAYYKVAQLQRAKLQDVTGALHPMTYFKTSKYLYQCAPDPTSTYFRFPHSYTKYRDPIVLPITLERTSRSPMLPIRSLTGQYSRQSDITYKK